LRSRLVVTLIRRSHPPSASNKKVTAVTQSLA
jgi:hypothetical protein